MICSLEDKIKEAQETAISKFLGKATGFTVKGNNISRRTNSTYSKDILYKVFESNLNRLKKWAKEEYGAPFAEGWGYINTYYQDNLSIQIKVPERLVNAFKVKFKEITLEQANNSLKEETVVPKPIPTLNLKESQLYDNLKNNLLISESGKEYTYKLVMTPKFSERFGDWQNGQVDKMLLHSEGEPKIFYLSNGMLFENYSDAVKLGDGVISMGFPEVTEIEEVYSQQAFDSSNAELVKFGDKYKYNSKDFIALQDIERSTDTRTTIGFLNNAILKGIISGEFKIAGNTTQLQTTNRQLLRMLDFNSKVEIDKETDTIKSIVRKFETLNIGGVEYSKQQLVEDYLQGKDVQSLLGVFDVNLLLIDHVMNNRVQSEELNPVSEKEEKGLLSDMMSFLKQLGFSVTTITNYAENYKVRNGVDLSVEAISDIANNVVAFAEGQLNEANITEETAHIIIEAYSNKDEINSLLPEVETSQEYLDYAEVYREKYEKIYNTPQEVENAIRKEILGKILAKTIVEQYNNISSNTNQSLLSTFSNIFKEFINNLKQFFLPSHKKQLNKFLKKAADIALRKDVSSLDTDGMGKNTILYSVGAQSKEEKDLISKNRRKKITLTKLKSKLETRLVTLKGLKDPETSKLQLAISELTEVVDNNDIEAGILVSIRVHSNQIAALKRRLDDYIKQGGDKSLFTQEDASAYNYFKDTVEPILSEMKAQTDDLILKKKLEKVINSIVGLKSSVLEQAANDPMNVVDDILKLRGETSQKQVDFITNEVTGTFKDVTSWTSTFGSLEHAANIFLNALGRVIQNLKTQANWATNTDVSSLITLAKKQGWGMNTFRRIIKYDKDGNNTGYLLSKKRYKDFYDEKEQYFEKVYRDILGNEIVDKYKKEKIQLNRNLIPDEQFSKFADAEIKWKLEQEELMFKPEYYSERNEQYNKANLSKDNRLFLEEQSRRRNTITSKYRVNGRVDYSKMSQVELDTLSAIRQELKARKSYIDAETGERKTGESLKLAEELKRLDEIRKEDIEARGEVKGNVSEEFIKELKSIEQVQGRDAALKFFFANSGIVYSDEYWNEKMGANKTEKGADSPLKIALTSTANEIEDIGERNRVIDIINSYVDLLDKRKEILKQHVNDLNPSEIDVTAFSDSAISNFLEIEEEIETKLKSINSIFSAYRKTLQPTTSTEVTVNEAYKNMLADSGMNELDFIKENVNNSSREKIKRFQNGLDTFGSTNLYLEKFIINFLVKKYSLGIYKPNGKLDEIKTLSNINNFLKREGKDKILVEYAKTKVASYFKRFAPEGYDAFIEDLKNNENKSVSETAEKLQQNQFKNFKLNTRYDWLQVKEEEVYSNPNFVNDNESGFAKPRLDKWSDPEYYNYFGIDAQGNATRNKEDFAAMESLKEVARKSLDLYNEKGLNVNKLPQISKSFIERANPNKVGQIYGSAVNWFNDTIKNRVDDLQYGEQVGGEDLTDAERVVPKYYLRDLESKADISEDLLNSYISLNYAANTYNQRISVIPEMLSLQQNMLQSTFENNKTPENTNTAKMFKNFFNAYIYGVKQTKKINVNILGKEVDLAKTITLLDRGKRILNNSFSLPIAFSSVALSNINLRLESYLNEHVSKESANYGLKKVASNIIEYSTNYGNINRQDEMYSFGEFFGLHAAAERTKNTSYGKIWKAATDLPFAMMTILSTPHTHNVMYAVLDDYRFTGKYFINYRTFEQRFIENGILNKDKAKLEWAKLKEQTAEKLLVKVEGTNTYTFKEDVINSMGLEQAKQAILTIKNKIDSVNRNIDGVVSDTDRSAATRHWLWNLTTSHKGWLTTAIDRRFKRRHFNQNTMEIEEGHYRSFKKLLTDANGIMLNPIRFQTFIKSILENYKHLNSFEQKNIRRVILELVIFATLSAISVLVAAEADDDDNEENNTLQLLSFLYFRTVAEQGNSQLPMGAFEFIDTVKEPFMIFSAISDIKEDFSLDKVKSGRYEGKPKILRALIKQTPVKQWYQINDMKATSDEYRRRNASVLHYAQKPKKDEESEESGGNSTLLDLERD